MKKLLIVVALLALSACSVQKKDMDYAVEACAPNGGVDYIFAYDMSAHCVNGAKFNIDK